MKTFTVSRREWLATAAAWGCAAGSARTLPSAAGAEKDDPAADPARRAFRARRREAAHRRRRLIFNNDGDDCVTILKSLPATAESLLARRTTPLVGSQVDSIFYCSLCGPKSYHPSEVSEVYTKSMDLNVDYYGKDTPTGQYFSRVKNIVPDLIAEGTDPLKVMVEFCRAHDIEIFCSMRMNDTHDGAHRPDKPYPDWPKFKQEYPEYLVGSLEKRPPHGQWTAYDYGQAAIRDRKFRRLEEVCRNYDVDGIELDFFRHGVLFRSVAWGGQASPEELDMMTELIRRLHRMTEDQGMKRGKPILIAVRVPDSVEYCRGIGLDIERWLSEGLVDILTTTCYFRLNPWEYSVELGHRYGVPVYASLSESRVNEKVDGKDGEFTRHWNPASYRARAMEAWQAGVDGIYMFNFFDPNKPEWRELGDPKTLEGLDKLYFVTVRRGPAEKGYVGWLAGCLALQNRTILTPQDPREIGLPEQWVTSRGAESVKYVRKGGKVGSRYILIEPTQVSALMQINIPVKHGGKYRISAYVKTEDFSCSRGDLAIVPTGWPASYGISLDKLKGTSDWKLVEEIVTAGESRDGRYAFYLNIMKSEGRIWFDAVKVEEVLQETPVKTGDNLLGNHDFATGGDAAFDLWVGDDLNKGGAGGKLPTVALHLRVQGLKETAGAVVKCNGRRLENGTLTEDRLVYPVAPELVRRGVNHVEVATGDESLPVHPWTLYDMVLAVTFEKVRQ